MTAIVSTFTLVGTTSTQGMGGINIPVTLTLTSTAVGRSIELSTNNGVSWYPAPLDSSTPEALVATVYTAITNFRATGDIGDTLTALNSTVGAQTVTPNTIPTYVYADRPTAATFGVGQAWFSDLFAMGYSDGVEWSIQKNSVTTSARDAVTEWWIQPIATYLNAPYSRVVHGAISSTGKILACESNLLKGTTKRIEAATVAVDDHNTPALWAEDGRRFLLAWSGHEANSFIQFKCSDIRGDIDTFSTAPTYQYASGGTSSYVQIVKIDSLSSAAADVFWVFNRKDGVAWQMIPVTVTQATGAITFGTAVTVFNAPGNQAYISIADEHVASGNQVIRVAWGYNPSLSLHAVFAFNIDVVTGAITNIVDGGFTANMDGTNLPITDTVPPTAFISEPSAGNSRRLFYVRPGPDTYAVAYADWATATPDVATYRVKEYPPTPGTGVKKTDDISVGYATAAYTAAMQTNTFEYEVFFKFSSTPTGDTELGRRANDTTTGNWYFRLRANRTVIVRLLFNASTQLDFTGTVPVPGSWANRIGLRLVVGDGLTPKVAVDYSLDNGDTWVNLESQNPAGLVNGFRTTTAPLIVGGLLLANETTKLTIDSATFKTGTAGTLIAGLSFAADWPNGDIVYTDAASASWSLVGPVVVNGVVSVTDLGIAGPRVGYVAGSNYIAGMGFQNPSYSRVVYTAHSDLTTETIKKHTLSYNLTETLVSQPTLEGRLIRPYSPVNNSPEEVIYTQMTEYSPTTYTNYHGNVKIL